MKHLVTNSRSYGGILTDSDHKIVIADINMDPKKIYEKPNRGRKHNIDVDKFQEDAKQQQYKENMSKLQIDRSTDIQERWDNIVKQCKNAGKQIMGKKEKNVQYNDEELRTLSEEKQKLKIDRHLETNKDKKR